MQQEANNVPIVPSVVTVEAAQARMAQALHFGADQSGSVEGQPKGPGPAAADTPQKNASTPAITSDAQALAAVEASRETLVSKGPVGETEHEGAGVGSAPSEENNSPQSREATEEQPDHIKRMAQIEMLKKRLLEAKQSAGLQSDSESEEVHGGDREESTTPEALAEGAKKDEDSDKFGKSLTESIRSRGTGTRSGRRRRRASSASTSTSRRRAEQGSIDESAEDSHLEVESIPDSLHEGMRQAIEEDDESDGEDDDNMSHASHSSAESMHVDEHLDGEELSGEELQLEGSEEEGLARASTVGDMTETGTIGGAVSTENIGEPPEADSTMPTESAIEEGEGEAPPSGKPSAVLGPPRLSEENLFAKKELPTLPSKEKEREWKRMSGASLLDFGGRSKSMKPVSALTALIADKKGNDNPFAAEYSFFSGKGDNDPMRLKIYVALMEEPSEPLLISVKRDATVEEVIGYALYEYLSEGREPPVPDDLKDVVMWNMRIVEDDGTVDDDFPALERTRKIQKFAFDQFAICQASPEQIKANERHRPPKPVINPTPIDTPGGTGGPSSGPAPTVFLKVHLYSTLEVKQTTTIQMPTNIPMSEVFEQICRKRKYDSSKYMMKMADTKTDVPSDKTLEQLRVTEFCILKKTTGGAGDIFLRPPDEQMSQSEQPHFNTPDGFSNMYRQYAVTHKQLMGRHERLLTIDGDYVHVMASENKNIFDTMKTTSHHVSTITACRPAKKSTSHIKLVVQGSKGEGGRTYDLEAASQQEAADICAKINFLMQKHQQESNGRLR
ncbi:hypothetical protein HDV00_007859 [Rhizophlyctis rosea]|nr:hypothetical protein HDV00_007859 [Rhizophlyctis rosea]